MVVSNDPGTCLHILELDQKTSSIIEGLGISEEREEEISKMVHHHYMMAENVVLAMANVSKECKHANELALAVFIMSARHHTSRSIGGAIIHMISGGKPKN